MLDDHSRAAAERHVRLAEQLAATIADIPDDTPTTPIARVGVVGGGTMGRGIAMSFLNAGLPVTLVETTPEALAHALSAVRKTYGSSVARGRLDAAEAEARLGLLGGALQLDRLAACDLIVEAVFEEMGLKKSVFAALDRIAGPHAILASNTSYLDLNEIASATGRPEQVVGAHFFSPAHVMKLLEVVRGARTSKSVVASLMKLAARTGKIPVAVGVGHGFVGNRMLAARQREAQRLIVEGALPWQVDEVLVEFGMPMGPFAMADLAGLDLGWSRDRSTGSTIRELLNEMDRRGQKTGAGFYDYDGRRTRSASPLVEGLIMDFSARQGVRRRPIGDEEILDRCLLPMINEGARLLEEGVATRASDIDVVWVHGYGWPVHRGGPMYYADSLGAAHVVERLKALEAAHGEAFRPAPLLERLAVSGGRFSEG